MVQVSLAAGAGSTFPARSTAKDRNAYWCPSAPKKLVDVEVVPTAPGTCAQVPPLSLTSTVYDTMSVVPETGPHVIGNKAEVWYCGRAVTAESGGLRSTIVQDWLVKGAVWTFPARSVPMERNSYVWPSWAPAYVPDVVLTRTVTQSAQAPPLSRTWIRYVATSSDSRLHWTTKLEEVCHTGRGCVEVYGGFVSTIVQVSFVAGTISMFPAWSVAFERN